MKRTEKALLFFKDLKVTELDTLRQRLISLIAGQRPLGSSGLCICLTTDSTYLYLNEVCYGSLSGLTTRETDIYAAAANEVQEHWTPYWASGCYIDLPGDLTPRRIDIAQKLLTQITGMLET